MNFRRIASIAALAAATVVVACSDSTGTLLHSDYSLQLQADSAQQYGVPECFNSSNMYCRGWRPSTTVIAATLNGSDNPVEVDQAGKILAVDSGSFNLDSAEFRLQNVDKSGCVFLRLRIKSTGNAVHGTWSEQQDCHGLTASGKVGGTRE